MKIVYSDKAPAAIGPYSQAIEANGFVFTSGSLGIIPETGELAEGLEGQTVQSLKNLISILGAAGLTLNNVVKSTCYLKNMEDFARFNEIYAKYFSENKPARSCFAVAQLPKNALVEVEVVAAK